MERCESARQGEGRRLCCYLVSSGVRPMITFSCLTLLKGSCQPPLCLGHGTLTIPQLDLRRGSKPTSSHDPTPALCYLERRSLSTVIPTRRTCRWSHYRHRHLLMLSSPPTITLLKFEVRPNLGPVRLGHIFSLLWTTPLTTTVTTTPILCSLSLSTSFRSLFLWLLGFNAYC